MNHKKVHIVNILSDHELPLLGLAEHSHKIHEKKSSNNNSIHCKPTHALSYYYIFVEIEFHESNFLFHINDVLFMVAVCKGVLMFTDI